MKRTITAIFLSAACAAVTAGGALASHDEDPSSVDAMADVVFVDEAAVQLVDGEPSQAELLVSGSLPSPCHQPAWEVEHADDAVRVWLWSWPGEDPACAASLEPVELSIMLGEIDAGSTVLLEGHPVAWAAEAPAAGVTTLSGAGWSFGMCLGYCAAELELSDTRAGLTGLGREQDMPLFANEGELTAEGLSQLGAATAALDGTTLESVYGCPDCADGGAAYIQLERDGTEFRHEMEFGAPPEALAEVYDLAMAISDALETCTSNELVTVAQGCAPYVAA